MSKEQTLEAVLLGCKNPDCPDCGTCENCEKRFRAALKEAEERGQREENEVWRKAALTPEQADELLEMAVRLIEDHSRICKYAHRRRGCKTPKEAQALIEKIGGKK